MADTASCQPPRMASTASLRPVIRFDSEHPLNTNIKHIIVVSDLHVGSTVALMPPIFRRPNGGHGDQGQQGAAVVVEEMAHVLG